MNRQKNLNPCFFDKSNFLRAFNNHSSLYFFLINQIILGTAYLINNLSLKIISTRSKFFEITFSLKLSLDNYHQLNLLQLSKN